MATGERASGRRFDRDHGVTTHALLFLGELDPTANREALSHATHYEAVPVAAFAALMAQIPLSFVREASFVDVGAGMGRAILLASEYPFKQVIGVELSRALAEIARENLQTAHDFAIRCRDVRLVRADARRHRFPPGDLVVFLYNPFDAQALDAVLERIASRPRAGKTFVLYHTPVHEDCLLAGGYEKVAALAQGVVYSLERRVEEQTDGSDNGVGN